MSYFEQCLGASYSPMVYGKHEGAHPQRVREAMAALKGRPEADVIAALVHRCEMQQLWLERADGSRDVDGTSSSCADATSGQEPSADDAHAMRLALENCRTLAARHREQNWAGHILRFCAEAGIKGSVLRLAQEEHGNFLERPST